MSYNYNPAYYAASPECGYAPGTAPQPAANYTSGYTPGYYANGYELQPAPPGAPKLWFDFSNGYYLKGFLIGAAIAVAAANPTVQKSVIRGGVKLWTGVQGGMEEIKEHVQDVKAEMSQES